MMSLKNYIEWLESLGYLGGEIDHETNTFYYRGEKINISINVTKSTDGKELTNFCNKIIFDNVKWFDKWTKVDFVYPLPETTEQFKLMKDLLKFVQSDKFITNNFDKLNQIQPHVKYVCSLKPHQYDVGLTYFWSNRW